MSIDFLNNQFQLDDFNSEDYLLSALISPVAENKRQEIPNIGDGKQTKMENTSEMKYNPQIPYLEHSSHPQNIPTNNMNNVIQHHNLLPHNNMLKHRVPSPNILVQNPFPQAKILPNPNSNVPSNPPLKIRIVHKRKIAESTNNLILPNANPTEYEQLPQEFQEFGEEDQPDSPTKKSKKGSKKSKKDTPKRKRVNYCFEIHRSGCALNKDAKLYCKVFLKGKLQSEVDLIKGARGKWAYTFYDQRKKKKERRYWPSQSSGPIIEDPCSCEKCVPSTINDDEVDLSSPSTEETTLVEYDHNQGNQMIIKNEYQRPQQSSRQQLSMSQFENQILYYPINPIQPSYHQNELIQEQYNQYMQINPNYPEYPKNVVLKSSNDFQDNRNHYLKSSNDFVNHQRPWDNYFQVPNNQEYNNDGFFVENNFL